MNRLFIAGLIAALSIAPVMASDFRIGVVDTERILRESLPATQAEKKIEQEFAARDQAIKQLIKQARELQAELEKAGNARIDAEHRAKERELANLNVNLQRLQREFREDLNLRKNEELALVLGKADKAIQAIALSEKFDLILQEAVYRTPQIDITDRVLQYLANEHP
jgi:outer membrane protein